MFSCEFCEIFKNTHFYRTPSVTVSGISISQYSKNCLRISTYITALGHYCSFFFGNLEKNYTTEARRFNIMDFDRYVFGRLIYLRKVIKTFFVKSNLNHDPHLRYRRQIWISVRALTSLTRGRVLCLLFNRN